MTSLLASLMAPANGSAGSSIAILVFQFGAIILIFYFLLIRPQSMARKKHAEILAALKKGDDVTTAGGIVGKVRDIKEDRVTIESGTATLVVERGRIVRVGESVSPGP
ncbi:MAG TPA: preprotein translocase subunit YajC [Gemmatimonadales bacterium]|jgi:preprotein translocase subunit YajC|nr:preprotein translocase subunit YajC [Gemmatimonadales bacterium]